MRLCSVHWDALRRAIDERGLTPFVAQDPGEARRRVVRELRDGPSAESFDPLMGAASAILSNAIECVGPVVMNDNDDGSERCPLCFLIAGCQCSDRGTPACDFAKWIGYAADGALAAAKRMAV